jgi:DNA-directed RNA polymerase specialized sigma24 family protein
VGQIETSASNDPADEIARRQLVELALDGLRPEVRATLVLRHFYGYDYAQIGLFLGMSSGTVGSTLSRAHAAIRRRFEALEAPIPSSDPRPAGAPAPPRPGASTEPPEVLP